MHASWCPAASPVYQQLSCDFCRALELCGSCAGARFSKHRHLQAVENMLLSWGSVQQDIGQRVARRTMHAVASRSLAFGCVTYRDFCWGVICNEDMSTCLRVHQPAILEDFPAS